MIKEYKDIIALKLTITELEPKTRSARLTVYTLHLLPRSFIGSEFMINRNGVAELLLVQQEQEILRTKELLVIF